MNSKQYIFLDRDGTIIVEKHYLSDPDKVELIAGVPEGLSALSKLGFGLIIVTNQSVVGRGVLDFSGLEQIHQRIREQLSLHDIFLDDIFFCPHVPEDHCQCRKPLPGMLDQAREKYVFDFSKCFVIGDKSCDIGLGKMVGASTILTRTGYGSKYDPNDKFTPDFVVNNLIEASQVIKRSLKME